MKILITTGIYPPKIGGPAQYAKNLKERLEYLGHSVKVKTFGVEDLLPTGIRHLFFFFKIIRSVIQSDIIFSLDTFSVGLPTVLASKIFFKKCVIRTGGDFLWEQYLERTKKKVLLINFYLTEKNLFSLKERLIFILTKWTLNNVSHTIYSTDWQRQIFVKGYGLDIKKTSLIENYYGPKESNLDANSKVFVGSARNLVLKNFDLLKKAFAEIKKEDNEIELFTENLPFQKFMEKISKCFAVVLISLGDVSPNIILDAIRYNRPFICTKEVGIYDRIKEAGIFVDPLNKEEIKNAIKNILTDQGYKQAKEKVLNFNFVHTWEQIAKEFLEIAKQI